MASVRQDSGIGGNGGAGISVGPQFMQAYFVGLTGILAGPIFYLGSDRGWDRTPARRHRSHPVAPGHWLVLRPLCASHEPDCSAWRPGRCTAAMAAVQESSGSPVAVLGYIPAYPISNILLTAWGTIMVLVVAG